MMALQIVTILMVNLWTMAVDALQYTDFPGIAIIAHLTNRLALCRQKIDIVSWYLLLSCLAWRGDGL